MQTRSTPAVLRSVRLSRWATSPNPQQAPTLELGPHFRDEGPGVQRVIGLTRVPQAIGDRARTQTQPSDHAAVALGALPIPLHLLLHAHWVLPCHLLPRLFLGGQNVSVPAPEGVLTMASGGLWTNSPVSSRGWEG